MRQGTISRVELRARAGRSVARGARWFAAALLVTTSLGCSRQIEEDPPIPEHRIGPCNDWCAMIFDPECPQDVEVKNEAECFDSCSTNEVIWGTEGDGHDAFAQTYIPFVECLTSLTCDERNRNFSAASSVPVEERSSCGVLERPQLDCQTEHY